jgi:hypothetical protein
MAEDSAVARVDQEESNGEGVIAKIPPLCGGFCARLCKSSISSSGCKTGHSEVGPAGRESGTVGRVVCLTASFLTRVLFTADDAALDAVSTAFEAVSDAFLDGFSFIVGVAIAEIESAADRMVVSGGAAAVFFDFPSLDVDISPQSTREFQLCRCYERTRADRSDVVGSYRKAAASRESRWQASVLLPRKADPKIFPRLL